MPYKDPAKQRAYQRAYKRRKAEEARQARRKSESKKIEKPGGRTGKPDNTANLFRPVEAFRIQAARDVLALLEETTNKVRALDTDSIMDVLQQARTIGYLCGLALKAVETSSLESRLSALEEVLTKRKVG